MKRVFLVEDEAVVAMELKDLLRTMGYEVCGHAARAAAALREIPVARPDLVIMDINLGPGMTGLDVADQLAQRHDVPVIFLTAYSDTELTERAARSGSFSYVLKPFEPRVLKANIELALVRREAETALRDNEYLLSESQRMAGIGSWRVDLATGVTTWTDETYRIYGVSRASFETTAAALLELLHPEDQGSMQAWIGASLAGRVGAPLEFRTIRPDGEVRVLLGRGELVRSADGDPRYLVGTVQDITERKHAAGALAARERAELERQQADERFVGVFEFAPDALLIVDQSGRIVLANRLAEQTLGYRRDELGQLTVEDLVPETERRGHAVLREGFFAAASPRRMGSARARLRARRKDGTTVPVEISLSPLRSEAGALVVAAVRDVSERVREEEARVRLEDQLRQAQKMESLGTLAGGIAHDFNNLLAAIVANIEIARDDVASPDTVAESLDDIAAAAARAGELVKQILAFSRQQPIARVVGSIRAVVVEAAKLLRATLPAGIQIVTELGEARSSALIDPTQIHQVLMNLGTNAWHAIDRTTGRIVLRLDTIPVAADPPPAASLPPGPYVRIQVSDDGKGMDTATRGRIFEPFFTTKGVGKGTGLGLSVAHGIVANHGGAIAVDSVPGSGTTFSVYLPATAAEPSSPSAPTVEARQRPGRVLLVEDEEQLIRVTTRLLERLGYQVTGFVRAIDALEAVRADPARFDVVITDQNMPEMDGLELAQEITGLRADLPIVLISGNRACSDDELAAANVHDRLDKPFSGALLDQAVRQALARR